MPDERWRPIPAYRLLEIPPGLQASSHARILGVSGVVLKQRPDKDGYATVMVGGKPRRVAILVQLAFAGPPEVRHLDDDRTNDRPDNLEWGSRWRNERDKKEGKDRKEGGDEIGGNFVTVPYAPVTSVTGVQDGL